jgi:hypothetical protein
VFCCVVGVGRDSGSSTSKPGSSPMAPP